MPKRNAECWAKAGRAMWRLAQANANLANDNLDASAPYYNKPAIDRLPAEQNEVNDATASLANQIKECVGLKQP